MTTNESEPKLLLWLIDSERTPLAACRPSLEPWADIVYYDEHRLPDAQAWENPPDAVFFSAEIAGGAGGVLFASLLTQAGATPLIAVARLRSLAQAVAYFRAGAADYLSLPLDEDDARERADAAVLRAETMAMQGVMVELEPVDSDPGEVSLSLLPSGQPPQDDDILAHIDSNQPEINDDHAAGPDDEPVAVDGLPIPSLWEELPCGLLVFDSDANLAFANQLALELFGCSSIAHLEDALENKRADFNACSINQKPVPDNQWPHVLAAKTRTPRSALLSIEKSDKRRAWLRIDCQPHLHDGKISRLLLTAVNLTGDLPPLAAPAPIPVAAPAGGAARKKGRAKKKGKK